MQRVQWHQGLSVGIDEIDRQHKALFNAVNAFLDTLESPANMEDIVVVMSFLEDYVVVHFDTELRAMKKHGYPLIDEHALQHEHFIETITYLKQKHMQWGLGTTSTLKVMLQRKLVNWLVDHIGLADKKLGAFLQDKPGGY